MRNASEVVREVGVDEFRMAAKQLRFHLDYCLLGIFPAYRFARNPAVSASPERVIGLRIVLFKACSAFTRVTACTRALLSIRHTPSEAFRYFVTSMAAPAASGWSGRCVVLAPTGKRRLSRRTPNYDIGAAKKYHLSLPLRLPLLQYSGLQIAS
jgi:hypothetical protein